MAFACPPRSHARNALLSAFVWGSILTIGCGGENTSGTSSSSAGSGGSGGAGGNGTTSTASSGGGGSSSTSTSSSAASSSSASSSGAGGADGKFDAVHLDGSAYELAQDASYVYVGVQGGLRRISKATLEVSSVYDVNRGCTSVVVGGDYAYVECTSIVVDPPYELTRIPLLGGPPTVLVSSDILNNRAMAAAPGALYHYRSPDLIRIDIDGVTEVVVASQSVNLPDEAAIDDTNYYVTYAGDVFAFPLGGGTVQKLVDVAAVKSRNIQQNTTHLLHLIQDSTIVRTAKDGVGGSVVVEGATGTMTSAPFAVDDASIYFFKDGALQSVPVEGGMPVVLHPLEPDETSLRDVILDGSAVWYIDGDSSWVKRWMP